MKKYVVFLVFTAFAAVMLPVCEGPVGPQGIQGEKGQKGEKGEQGDAGEPGEKGEDGTNGLSITWKGSLNKSPEKPQINWAYYNRVDKKSYIYDGKNWQILAQDGEPGQQGSNGEGEGEGEGEKEPIEDWLKNQSGGDSEDDPVSLRVKINLDDWQELLEAIEAADKFVELDLSQCEMSGTVFNPDSGIKTGKDKIVSITLPDKATEIAKGSSIATSAFNSFVNLRSLNAANLAEIGAYAFYDCSKLVLTELPEDLTKINTYSFRSCASLALKTLPPGVTEIGINAFNGCSGIVEMTLYEKVTKIGNYAFNGCGSLKFFTCLAETPPSLGLNDFNKNPNLVIKVPAASLDAYKTAANWKDLADKIIPIGTGD